MLDYLILQLQIDKEYHEEDFESMTSRFHLLLDNGTELINEFGSGAFIPERHQIRLNSLAIKFFFNSYSLLHLAKGVPFYKNQSAIFDLSSIFLLRRALLENYFTILYLFFIPQSMEELNCKFLIYEMSGYKSRQKPRTSTKESESKLAEEAKQIEQLTNELKLNTYFLSLKVKDQSRILNGRDARILGWVNLIRSSHVRTGFFEKDWILYSSYAHSEMLGIIQLDFYSANPAKMKQSLHHTMFMALVTLCCLITDLQKKFPFINDKFNNMEVDIQNHFKILSGFGLSPEIKS